jgi:hypothetical protein
MNDSEYGIMVDRLSGVGKNHRHFMEPRERVLELVQPLWRDYRHSENMKEAAELNNKDITTAYQAAIDHAISVGHDALGFLNMWNEGDWKQIAKYWPKFDLTTTGQCDSKGELL